MTTAPAYSRRANIFLSFVLLCAGLIFLAPIACTQVAPASPAADKTSVPATATTPASAPATAQSTVTTPAATPAENTPAFPPAQFAPSAPNSGPGTPVVQIGGSAVRPQNGDYYSQVYKIPTEEEITAVLQRVRVYLDASTASRLVAGRGGQVITDFSQPVPGATFEPVARGGRGPIRFQAIAYEQGVVYSGMLAAAEATQDPAFNDYVVKRLTAIMNGLAITPVTAPAPVAPPAPADPAAAAPAGTGARGARGRGGFGLSVLRTPRSLDDCGAMCAALIQARLANVGPDTTPIILNWMKYINTTLFRLPDGTIARHIPMPETIWADDMYMGAPALALMGKLTGETKYYDDAAKQILQMSARLFRPEKGLFAHGWITTNPDTVDIFWGRANGWCALAMADVLDLLPADHPARPAILNLFRAFMKSIVTRQSDKGLWHQLLDRDDSYLETSASAMFVYALAHGVNRGWISPVYATQALVGWNALAQRVNAQGQVEGTCTGGNFDLSPVYYYNHPVSVDALHGYGPVLLAGAEVINLLYNDKITIVSFIGSIYVSPKPDAPMPWLEDGRTPAK